MKVLPAKISLNLQRNLKINNPTSLTSRTGIDDFLYYWASYPAESYSVPQLPLTHKRSMPFFCYSNPVICTCIACSYSANHHDWSITLIPVTPDTELVTALKVATAGTEPVEGPSVVLNRTTSSFSVLNNTSNPFVPNCGWCTIYQVNNKSRVTSQRTKHYIKD